MRSRGSGGVTLGPEQGESEADSTPLGVDLVPNSHSLLSFSCWSRRRPFITAAQVKVQLSKSQVASGSKFGRSSVYKRLLLLRY